MWMVLVRSAGVSGSARFEEFQSLASTNVLLWPLPLLERAIPIAVRSVTGPP